MIGLELTPEHPVSELSDLAVRAEGAGFDTIFASHHYNNRDEFVALADIARATDEVRLGPGITNPYETHPVTLASRSATLDELSDGRGVFGVGAGDRSTLSNLGYDDERPLRRVLETMQVARRLWDGERVDHDGTFQAVDAGLNYDARRLPVYVGAQGPDMTRMAAKYADGVLFNGSHPLDIAWASDRVEEGLDDRPDERGEFDFAAYASVSIAEDADDAREAARPPVAFIAGSAPPPVLDRHDLDRELAGEIGETIAAGEFREAFGLVTPAMVDAFCIAGTPDTVESRVEAVMAEADSIVVGSPLGPDLETAIDLAGGAVRRALA
ncbi:5,10-methylenetetrahydromethanopterin reductase [Salinibaculum salinum]|uniref:5,10-methylenetetrahydromethanopterin reductase n=1 Tax=Salinibaculum salinum TaxID=3131996 RepID=UPI0030ECA871